MTHVSRRVLLQQAFLAGVGSLALPRLLQAQIGDLEQNPEWNADLVTTQTQRAIDQGLAYLASRQSENGSFGGIGGNEYGRNVAVVSLAGLAFMSAGNMPGRGPHGENVTRCLEYIDDNTLESGLICYQPAASHGPMYGHGFATLFLAEAYGMTPDTSVRDKLAQSVKLIIEAQNPDGGWRYLPQSEDADLSVTICQIMALRAARNAGVYVPNETIDLCTEYVKRSQNPDGGFTYQLNGGPSLFPRSAAGVVALYSAGVYDSDEITKGLDYLMNHVPRHNDGFTRDNHYYYGQYYAVQAMWHAGGKHWSTWYPAIRDELMSRQLKDGYWRDQVGSEYATAMACIILQMPNNYLPIFQR
ncbi:prenyltransferase/squalene oxidase repeat-containing protein [Lignipirellula cremea]|uniref:Prenyltransferase and squalene oxidase repeat protein n=1 Tax=Lignipirellula cremea TaxID=2528010 RepID=A0A518DY90_9BACT|nr:prenyltransferase/squalene oxidase repeat-containing protein [Lignipirellula cremea]QDU96810.1 Prenyltransferase and squalene oxidase repeat protein [Lignipirellula cremea]